VFAQNGANQKAIKEVPPFQRASSLQSRKQTEKQKERGGNTKKERGEQKPNKERGVGNKLQKA